MEENKTKKELWQENLRNKYPDRDFSNEDEFYGASMEGYDQEHDYRKKTDASNSELAQLLTENPDVAMFIGSLVNKESLPKALSYLSDLIPLSQDDEGWEDYNRGIGERKAKEQKLKEAEEAYVENVKKSAETLKEFADEMGMSEQEAIDFVSEITTTINDKLFSGNIDKDFLTKFYNLLNYDKDIELSKEAGRIEGRNEQIAAKRAKVKKSDGLPNLKATSAPIVESEDNPTIGALNELSKRAERKNQMFG